MAQPEMVVFLTRSSSKAHASRDLNFKPKPWLRPFVNTSPVLKLSPWLSLRPVFNSL